MTILPSHTASRIRNRSMGILHLIAADEACELSDILALLPFPSQPASQAPAADTPAPPPAGDQTEEVVPTASSAEQIEQPLHFSDQPDGAENEVVTDTGKSGEAPAPPAPRPPGRPETVRSKILAVHQEHPTWPSKLIAQHLGISEDAVRATASRKQLKLVSWWDYERALKAETQKALAASVERPQEAAEPPSASEAKPEPERPPSKAVTAKAARPVARQPGAGVPTVRQVTAPNEPMRVPPSSAPRGATPGARFYVRDAEGLYLHQSLDPSPTSDGPLMTGNRKWAWFDNMQRFRGAAKKWPGIEAMRKEGAAPK